MERRVKGQWNNKVIQLISSFYKTNFRVAEQTVGLDRSDGIFGETSGLFWLNFPGRNNLSVERFFTNRSYKITRYHLRHEYSRFSPQHQPRLDGCKTQSGVGAD